MHEHATGILRSVIAGGEPERARSTMGTVKAIVAAIGGLAGITAASVGISALRRREERARGKS
jgi:hypothetical protein